MSRQFRIEVSPTGLDDLRRRLVNARWPAPSVRGGWQDGVDIAFLREMTQRWAEKFDWPARVEQLNRLPHRAATVDGLKLHFVHHRVGGPPVLLLHGWPSTFVQMGPLAEELVGGDGPAMDVVIPSLPGFGYSERPLEPGWNLARMGAALHRLMVEELGYSRYLVRGSDFGLFLGLWLGAHRPEHVAGVHVGGAHLRVDSTDADLPEDLAKDELNFVHAARNWYRHEAAYNDQQATKPLTLGVALEDSPAGLLAWIAEKYRTWGTGRGDGPFGAFDVDDILTMASIYWTTGTASSSAMIYREEHLDPTPMLPVRVPLTITQSGLEEYPTPERWWRRTQPVTRYVGLADAAHFPEWEAPQALAADLRAFARTLSIGT